MKERKPLTAAQLKARLHELEEKLAAREAERGARDPVLRQVFEQARREIDSATNDAERREAWRMLGDIAAQFPP